MNNFTTKLKLIFADKTLRRRALFTLGALVIFRLLATLPIPGIDAARLQALFSGSQFLGLLDIFSGGGLSNLSIIMLGVGPYITASIIMQLLTLMIPSLKEMYQEDGEAGRKKFAMYSRLLMLPLAVLQAFSFIIILQRQAIIPTLGAFDLIGNILIITAGSALVVWIGELITEFGIGNGVSLIIFAGIVSRIPVIAAQLAVTFDPSQIPLYALLLASMIAVVYAVVFITEAERPIPVTYAKRVRGMKVYGGVSTYLPLRLNQSGVIPIIFALSILLFPQMIFSFFATSTNVTLAGIAAAGTSILANQWIYGVAYFFLVFLFTYFYTAVTFDPEQIAENLQRNGAFIPGVRPGKTTSEHIYKILTRITLFGALFLGVVAVLPIAVQGITGITSVAIGGTALLIVVSVVIDLVKKIEAQLSMREY